MPVCIDKQGKKWRIVECESRKITKNKANTAVDGGGHNTKGAALKQMSAINRSA